MTPIIHDPQRAAMKLRLDLIEQDRMNARLCAVRCQIARYEGFLIGIAVCALLALAVWLAVMAGK